MTSRTHVSTDAFHVRQASRHMTLAQVTGIRTESQLKIDYQVESELEKRRKRPV